MRAAAAFAFVFVAVVVSGSSCTCGAPVLPAPPGQCSLVTGLGCLPDEQCADGVCVPLERCEGDEDCPSVAFRCVFPAQFCELRPGFGEECSDEQGIPCGIGQFCALGLCRDTDIEKGARACNTRLDCAPGFGCDQVHFFCIEEAPCSFADEGYPETACNPNSETCSPLLDACISACINECTPGDDATCPDELRCNAACDCVTCLNNDDCGAGLICNIRAGRCQSENLCFSDADCESPLICDFATQLCQVAPPACEDDFDCQIAEICNLATTRCELPTGECLDDRLEDSDTPATARLRVPGVGGPALFDDLVLCPGDDDVYSVELLAGDGLLVKVTERARPAELQGIAHATVYLLDSAAETSLDFAETAPRGNGVMYYVAQVDETVFVRISALLGATFYDLELEKFGDNVCAKDRFEGDTDNDEVARAFAVTPDLIATADQAGVDLEGEVCPGDSDVYAVDVAAGQQLTTVLDFDAAAADLDVAYVDAQNNVLQQRAGTSAPEVLAVRFLEATRVFVRVRGFANTFAPYTIRFALDDGFVCSDAGEPDDEVPEVLVVDNVSAAAGGSAVVEARAVCGNATRPDADRWAIDVEDFERLVVHAVPTTANLRVVLAIEDVDGNVLKRSAIGPGASSVSFDAVSSTTLFVRATGAFNQQGNYTIDFHKENQTDCAADDFEVNDTVAGRAALIDETTPASICETDEDFYAFEGVAGKVLTIDLTFLHGDADLDLQLLGLDGVQILATSDGQLDNEQIVQTLPLDGTYTIRVFSLTSGAKSQYVLSTDLASP